MEWFEALEEERLNHGGSRAEMYMGNIDNLSIPLGGGARGRLQAWIRTRPAPADPTSIVTLHDEVIAHMASRSG